MNNKKNKNSSYVKKIILTFVIILAIMFVYNVILEYKESKNAYKITENDKTLLIKYTLVDKEKMKDSDSVDDLWHKHPEALYNIVEDYVILTEEKDYYVADLNYTNDIVKKDISDVDFAINNLNGIVLEDCKFDKEKLKLYIPKKYYDNIDAKTPVQAQVLSKLDNDNITINYKKGNEKRNIVADIYDNVLKIPIEKNEVKGRKINASDITIYINGKKYYLDKSNSNYLKNGSLDIDYNAILVNSIEVKKTSKNLLRKVVEKLFAASIVNANPVTVNFSNDSIYKPLATIPTSEAVTLCKDGVCEDNGWHFSIAADPIPNTSDQYYNTQYSSGVNDHRATVDDPSSHTYALAYMYPLTYCSNYAGKDESKMATCLKQPFDNMNGIHTGTGAESQINPLSDIIISDTDQTNTYNSQMGNGKWARFSYCESYNYSPASGESLTNNTTAKMRRTCNNYYGAIYQCMNWGSSYSRDYCTAYAYFYNMTGHAEAQNLFNGLVNSYDKLIYKRTDNTTNNNMTYINTLFSYAMISPKNADGSINNKDAITNDIIGNDNANAVFQFMQLPASGGQTTYCMQDCFWGNESLANSHQFHSSTTWGVNLKKAVGNNGWVTAICGHPNTSAYTGSIYAPYAYLGIRTVKYVANDYVVLAFATQNNYSTGQEAFAIYKFDIGNKKTGKLQITKSYTDSDDASDIRNVVFDIYEGTESGGKVNCGRTPVASSSTSQSATKTVTGLELNKPYCIWERGSEHNFDTTYKIGSTNVTRNATFTDSSGTYKVGFVTITDNNATITTDTSTNTDIYTLGVSASNKRKKYCFAVKKLDEETLEGLTSKDDGDSNKKFTFTSNGQTVSTTTSSNIAVFGPFNYGTYTVKETNVSEGVTADQGIYWTNAPNATISTSNLVEANSDGTCPSIPAANAIAMKDVKHYYCARIQKVDASSGNVPLAGAKFTSPGLTGYNESGTANGETETSGNKQGYYYFFTGNNPASIAITESQVPSGYYANSLTVNVTPVLMANTIRANSSIADQIAACNTAYTGQTSTQVNNYRYLLNWFKVDENGTNSNGAKFIVQDSDGKYLKLGAVQEQADKDGHDKKCYPLTGTTTNRNQATEVVSQDVGVHSTAKDGEVCIMGLNPGNYKIIETDSIESHTFGSFKELTIASSESYQSKTNANTFVNYPTRIELDKKSTSTDDYTNSELTKIIFNLYRVDQNGNPVGEPITLDDLGNGLYDYISQTSQTTSLHVNGDAKLVITHLPKDNYIIMENQTDSCDDSTDPTKCIGYYMPTGSENGERFTITKCSSDEATSCGIGEYGKEIVTVWNTPTQIDFTELDYYRIYDQSDIAIEGNTVDGIYSTQMDRSDFDRMVFTLYDKDNNPVSLQFVGNHGDCTSDDDYAEYRYVIGGEATGVTDLHTCGGHLRVTHLCRGATYTIKEQLVAENSVFVLEDTPSTPTQKDYKIACKPDDPTPPVTETNILENKPTRVTFEKRDAKYSYLIPDETTTFEVYRCPNGEECHPGDYSTVEQREAAGMELVKFYSRAVIPGDEEDPGVEVYKMMSYSDAQNRAKCEGNNTNNCYVTSIHPIGGKVIFRYLASGYNYVLYETVAPKNYLLPVGRDAENAFTVRTDTVSVEEVRVPNQPTGLLIRKYDDEGRLLGGAKFKVSEVVNYNPNKKAQEQQLTNLKFKTIKQGVYEYRPVLDSSLVITCEGSSCSDTSSFSFDQDWSNFDTLLTSSGETIKNVLTEGTAIIQYLEYGKYYVIEEVEAPKGHSLPEGDARYTLIHIGENTSVIEDTEDTFINYPTAFTFYKFDEYNNLLDGAKFKLQKLNDNKSYITLNVTKVEGEDSLYKVDNTSTNDIIETTNGKATVYYLEEGQYRVVEVQAPDGKELPKKTLNVATFFVDKDGNVFGENIITNKAPTDKTIVKPTAKANLIINIQTGQNVVKYGLIIAILVAAITGLMIYMKKRK